MNFYISNNKNGLVHNWQIDKRRKIITVGSGGLKEPIIFSLKDARKIIRNLFYSKYAQSEGFRYRIICKNES